MATTASAATKIESKVAKYLTIRAQYVEKVPFHPWIESS